MRGAFQRAGRPRRTRGCQAGNRLWRPDRRDEPRPRRPQACAVRHKGAVDDLAARNDSIAKYNAETRELNARNTAKQ